MSPIVAEIPGIHHVTCITGDVQKCTDFYVSVLGLRFVKKSINQDLPDTYHIYFGDYLGSPGTAMTFFGWPTWPSQRAGSGQVTTVSFQVPSGSLGFWSKRLNDMHVDHRMVTRFDADSNWIGLQHESVRRFGSEAKVTSASIYTLAPYSPLS